MAENKETTDKEDVIEDQNDRTEDKEDVIEDQNDTTEDKEDVIEDQNDSIIGRDDDIMKMLSDINERLNGVDTSIVSIKNSIPSFVDAGGVIREDGIETIDMDDNDTKKFVPLEEMDFTL